MVKKFAPSRKFKNVERDEFGPTGSDDTSIQPWTDDESKTKLSKEKTEMFLKQDISAGLDVVGEDVFSGGAQYGGSSSKGYKPQTPEAAKQLLYERSGGIDLDTEIELRQSIVDAQNKAMEIRVQEKPGVQKKEFRFDQKLGEDFVLEGEGMQTRVVKKQDQPLIPDTTTRMPGEPSQFKVTSEGVIEEWATRPVGIKSKQPIGIKGVNLEEQKALFKNAEELAALKNRRTQLVRDINKELYNIDYDKDVLTESDYKKIEVGARAMGTTTSEVAETIIQDKTTREAATGDVFEQKKDWKESSAYDLSLIEEGNPLRDYQEDVMQNRFADTPIEDRVAQSGVGQFKEYPKGGGKGGVTIPNLGAAANVSGSGMTNVGATPIGWRQQQMFQEAIVPIHTISVDNVSTIPYAQADYVKQAQRILGRNKAQQHLRDIVNPNFQGGADPQAPSAIVVKDTRPVYEVSPEGQVNPRNINPDVTEVSKTTPIAPQRSGPAFDALLARHQKIERAAEAWATIRKDISEVVGDPTKPKNVKAYFMSDSPGLFKDVRSATIAGLDAETIKTLNLPAVSKKTLSDINKQQIKRPNIVDITGTVDPSKVDTRYGTGVGPIKQEGPKGTTKPQTVVPNPDAPNYGINEPSSRREIEYKKRDIAKSKSAEWRARNLPGVALTPEERALQIKMKAAGGVAGLRGVSGIIKGLSGGGKGFKK